MCSKEHELEAICDLVDAVFDRYAGHALIPVVSASQRSASHLCLTPGRVSLHRNQPQHIQQYYGRPEGTVSVIYMTETDYETVKVRPAKQGVSTLSAETPRCYACLSRAACAAHRRP